MPMIVVAHAVGARHVIPCHYNMFKFNTEPPDDFVEICEKLNQPHRVLNCGERLTLEAAP